MDPEIANVLQAACYSAAAFGGVYAIARYSFLKRKSDNETHAERVRADMDASKLEIELSKQKIELMNTPQFKDYQDRRFKAMQELREHNDGFDGWCNSTIEGYLDAIVGCSPLE